MPQPTTQERNQADSPEISAFRYTASSERDTLAPLNLNGLRFATTRKSLSDRLLSGIRFLVSVPPRPAAPPEAHETRPEDLGVFRYQIPLSEYRERRRANLAIGRRIALVGGLAVSLPLAAFLAWKSLPAQAPSPRATVAQATAAQAPASPERAQAPAALLPAATRQEPARANATPLVLAPTLTYTVKAGDTLSEIAKAHHVTRRALRERNGLGQETRLKIGQTLLIPTAVMASNPQPPVLSTQADLARHEAGGTRAEAAAPERRAAEQPKKKRTRRTTYAIQEGDTLSEIAAKFDLRVADLVAANDLGRTSRLKIGRKLVIPSASEGEGRSYRQRDKRKVASRGLMGDLGRAINKRFLWPTAGRLSSGFGYRGDHFHAGLDITNRVGAPIHASKAGVVVSAGWDGAYGKTVDVRHANGVVTRYAHCSKIMVSPGERVERGQTIALVGETGRATGPHVHYEVRINGRAVDPKKFI